MQLQGQKGQLVYSASKGAVIGMTLPMARDLARYGIRVMTIAPGIIDTPLMQAASDKVKAGLLKQVVTPNHALTPRLMLEHEAPTWRRRLDGLAVIGPARNPRRPVTDRCAAWRLLVRHREQASGSRHLSDGRAVRGNRRWRLRWAGEGHWATYLHICRCKSRRLARTADLGRC